MVKNILSARGKAQRNNIRSTWDDRRISIICYTVVTLFALTIIYPMLNLISVSMSSYTAYLKAPSMFVPRDFDFTAFSTVISSRSIMRCYGNTVFITAAGTTLTLLLTTLTAYPLSRPQLKGKAVYMTLIIITMMLNAGTIPNFLLIRDLGLYNSIWALFIMGTVSAYYVILMLNFFRSIPDSVLEAARVDGANEAHILLRIILPLSAPIMATIGLFRAVTLWNSYFAGIVYIRDRELWPVQLALREIIMACRNRDGRCRRQSGGNQRKYSNNFTAVRVAAGCGCSDHVYLSFCAKVFRQRRYAGRSKRLSIKADCLYNIKGGIP